LRWCALRFSINVNANVNTYVGIPYNPYAPNPYKRWTASKLDPRHDLLVQEELWKEFAGDDVFSDLLAIFQEVGLEMKSQISDFLASRDTDEG
jgi:type II restriction enzyme